MFDFILVPAYDLLSGLAGRTGAAVAIALFTVAVRTLLLPLAIRQARIQRIRLRLTPEIQKLRKRFAHRPERLQREVNALYAREGTSMFAGLGTALAQAPFFMVAYRLFTTATIGGHPNLLLAQGALGVPLGEHFGAVLAGAGLFSAPAAVFLGLLALLALVAWAASRDVPQDAAMRGLMRALPFGTLLMAAVLPFAAGIYLLISTAWSTAERRILVRPV
jgi:YidC/Oxa1 family membrane protein insertase